LFPRSGRPPTLRNRRRIPIFDALMAAIAMVEQIPVVTHDSDDVGGAGAEVIGVSRPHTNFVFPGWLTVLPRRPVNLDRQGACRNTRGVSQQEIETYLARLDEPKQSTLRQVRQTILEIIPDAEECIAYSHPAFRIRGTVVAGFGAFKNHLSYLPHSGSVFPELQDELASFVASKGALQFPIDAPLSRSLVEQLVNVRMMQAFSE
jgi:uncharacterized protein YdhG (YjbR/CyaY superfamily)